MLLISGLPQLQACDTYELWIERGGEIVGIGTFEPGGGGLAAEPTGGSEAPSADDVIMQGELSL